MFRTRSTLGLAIGMAGLAMQAALAAGPAGQMSEFYRALESGDTESALRLGANVYPRLAFRGQHQGIYLQAGFLLASWAEAAADTQRDILSIGQHPGGSRPPGLAAIWRQYEHSMNQVSGMALPQDDIGRFLESYLALCFDAHAQVIMLAVRQKGDQKDPQRDALLASRIAAFLCLGELETAYNMPNVKEAASWVVASGPPTATGAIVKDCMARRRYGAACLLSKALLSAMPGDGNTRQQFLELIAEVRKAGHAKEARRLCGWARDTVKDAAAQVVFLLQEAIIAARDDKDYGAAISLCDRAAEGLRVSADSVSLAKCLAGAFLLSAGDREGAIQREQVLVQDASLPPKYRSHAATVLLKAWTELGRPEKGIEIVSAFLNSLSEPEPEEACDCRQALYVAMLNAQRYDEAADQCRLLIARHPGTPAAKAANAALVQIRKAAGLRKD